jgi:hypothetical protein
VVKRREGGYKRREEGGYKRREEGGYKRREEGGYKRREEGITYMITYWKFINRLYNVFQIISIITDSGNTPPCPRQRKLQSDSVIFSSI